MASNENGYRLSVPISKKQWVTVVSNRRMTAEGFRRLNAYLTLQAENLCEDDEADALITALEKPNGE